MDNLLKKIKELENRVFSLEKRNLKFILTELIEIFNSVYKRYCLLNNSYNPNNLTSYQLKIILDTESLISAGKLKPDGSDLRFIDISTIKLLDYWIESGLNTNSTIIWVKIPFIPAFSTKTIYLFYGNPYSNPKSSVTNTFIYEINGGQPLKGNWSFDEGSGLTLEDRSGNGNNGTINGATWINGKYGKALNFDGVNDYVIINPVINFPTTEITVAFWMKSSDTINSGTPISYASSNSDNDFLITDYRNFAIYKGASFVYTGISANDGQWHYIVVTWKSADGSIKFYKDGALAFSGTLATGTSITQGGSLVFGQEQDTLGGGFSSNKAFNGILDEVNIYDRVLTENEILNLYNYYGYATVNYPGRTLIKKYSNTEPIIYISEEF